jgi:hypothetical protein
VILSYGLWQHDFGSDLEIVGKMITLHGVPRRVAGVMLIGLSFPEAVQAWAPLTDDVAFAQNRRSHLFTTLARGQTGRLDGGCRYRFAGNLSAGATGKWLKDMVGTWGLEPQTSTVSILRSTI